MLIGRTILQYAIGRVAPFPQRPFSDFSPAPLTRACVRISPGRESLRRNGKNKGRKIINKRKEYAASAASRCLMNIYLGQTRTVRR